jgi:hypothetical protein
MCVDAEAQPGSATTDYQARAALLAAVTVSGTTTGGNDLDRRHKRRTKLADNKENVGEPDRSRVSGSEDYEVRYFAERHGISVDQARELIETHGNNREELDRAAESMKRH